MVRIELTNEDAKLVAGWLAESFWRLEIGGSHRIAAVRFYDQLVKKYIPQVTEQLNNNKK